MNWLKINSDYSAEEWAFMRYGFYCIVMEVSKFIIMLLLFTIIGKPFEFLFGTFILLLLRSSTGGLHLTTYIGCLLFSSLFFYAGCIVLPAIGPISSITMFLLLLGCIIIIYQIGPVVSEKRPVPTLSQIRNSKKSAFRVIFLYSIITFVLPENSFVKIGFWIIILQTLQLIIAYFLRKEDTYEKQTC